jgi:UrcA family protein
MSRPITKVALLVAGPVLAVLPAAAGARDYDWLRGGRAEPARVGLDIRDLDLASPAGARMVERRMAAAVHAACSGGPDRSIEIRLDERGCAREAMAGLRAAVAAARARAAADIRPRQSADE